MLDALEGNSHGGRFNYPEQETNCDRTATEYRRESRSKQKGV
jgi:hypothetical protein